jgi:hypothetical protein
MVEKIQKKIESGLEWFIDRPSTSAGSSSTRSATAKLGAEPRTLTDLWDRTRTTHGTRSY